MWNMLNIKLKRRSLQEQTHQMESQTERKVKLSVRQEDVMNCSCKFYTMLKLQNSSRMWKQIEHHSECRNCWTLCTQTQPVVSLKPIGITRTSCRNGAEQSRGWLLFSQRSDRIRCESSGSMEEVSQETFSNPGGGEKREARLSTICRRSCQTWNPMEVQTQTVLGPDKSVCWTRANR